MEGHGGGGILEIGCDLEAEQQAPAACVAVGQVGCDSLGCVERIDPRELLSQRQDVEGIERTPVHATAPEVAHHTLGMRACGAGQRRVDGHFGLGLQGTFGEDGETVLAAAVGRYQVRRTPAGIDECVEIASRRRRVVEITNVEAH